MRPGAFWVLTQDDLRGIHIYNEALPGCPLDKKDLAYASFFGCDLHGADLERTQLSCTRFDQCNLRDAVFAGAGGLSPRIVQSDLTGACLWESWLYDVDLSGSDLRAVYWEGARLVDVTLDHRTYFDLDLARAWRTRTMPLAQRPDILRAIRLGYEHAQIWDVADRYLHRERTETRKHIRWPDVKRAPSIRSGLAWSGDWIAGTLAGYGTKPLRLIAAGLLLSVVFGAAYWAAGTPHGSVAEALYLSFTTFATLGYGDVVYGPQHPVMRFVTTAEAWLGAALLSAFVAALARKAFR